MQTTLLSSKGQVIIPKALRLARHWGPGTRLAVQDTPEGVLLRPMPLPAKADLASGLAAIRERVGYRGPVISLAQMDAAVLREATRISARAARKPAR